jgi:hypothetical protein
LNSNKLDYSAAAPHATAIAVKDGSSGKIEIMLDLKIFHAEKMTSVTIEGIRGK